MSLQPVVPGVYQISFGMVSAYRIDDNGLTSVDTVIPGSPPVILDAVRELGTQPKDVGSIALTHQHAAVVDQCAYSSPFTWVRQASFIDFLKMSFQFNWFKSIF